MEKAKKIEKARGGPTIHSFGCWIIIPELAAPNCIMGIFLSNLEPSSWFFCNFLWFGLVMVYLAIMTLETKKMAAHEFLLPINLPKVSKLWKFGFFPPLAFAVAFKILLAFFQFSWPVFTENFAKRKSVHSMMDWELL